MDKRPKKVIKETVRERIAHLLSEARSEFRKHPERSERYLRLLWKLVEKYKVRLTREQRLSFCRKCFTLWVPGRNVEIFFDQRNSVLEYRCGKCGYRRRLKYK
jgi:ribonuclease P protein subunit RPR2